MLGISYRKANPTDYVLLFSRGKLTREGVGLSFFYFSPASSIVSVPLASANIPFVFNEPTADFQTLTVQGQMTYRITDPKKAAQCWTLLWMQKAGTSATNIRNFRNASYTGCRHWFAPKSRV